MRKLIISIVIVIIIAGAAYFLLRPDDKPQGQLYSPQIEQLAQLPGYRLVKQQEPILWQEIVINFRKALAKGAPFTQAVGDIRGQLTELVNVRMVKASDDAVLNYISVAVDEMQDLNEISAESCFNFLYPQVAGGVNLGRLLPAEINLREQQALEQLFLTSQGADKPRNTALAGKTLSDVVAELYPQWGNQLQQLNQPEDISTDHQKLCAMSIELYRSILKRPAPVAANVIRQMVVG